MSKNPIKICSKVGFYGNLKKKRFQTPKKGGQSHPAPLLNREKQYCWPLGERNRGGTGQNTEHWHHTRDIPA